MSSWKDSKKTTCLTRKSSRNWTTTTTIQLTILQPRLKPNRHEKFERRPGTLVNLHITYFTNFTSTPTIPVESLIFTLLKWTTVGVDYTPRSAIWILSPIPMRFVQFLSSTSYHYLCCSESDRKAGYFQMAYVLSYVPTCTYVRTFVLSLPAHFFVVGC